jgi:ABC-type lipoprotein export system ATPase subunit
VSAPPVIVVRDLVKRFRIPDATTTFVALALPSLEVWGGEAVAVIGPSGSGKTTLFHIIAGLLSPSQGEVRVHGVALGMLHGKDRDRWRAKTIGYVFQSFNLLPAFSALENVCLALDLGVTIPRAARRARARALLGELGLGLRMHHRPGELSTGEQQRVAVARALANAPEVLLADEPTANVDPETREIVLSRLLHEAHTSKKVLIVATHDHSLLTRFDRVIRLDQPDYTVATPC